VAAAQLGDLGADVAVVQQPACADGGDRGHVVLDEALARDRLSAEPDAAGRVDRDADLRGEDVALGQPERGGGAVGDSFSASASSSVTIAPPGGPPKDL
jgi:hypothetical protein